MILLSADGGASLKAVLRRLSTLGSAGELEIVAAIPPGQSLVIDPSPCFAGFRVVHAPLTEDIGKGRGAAIRAATAPFVVLGEDHSFPAEGWPQALLVALENGAAGAGPQMRVANPETSISWSEVILCYGAYLQPQRLDHAASVPWHNSAFRRDALLELGDRLDFLLQADSALMAALASRGHRFALTPDAATEHCNTSQLWPCWFGLFWGNRLYGANRATSENWPLLRRLFYALCWPAIVALRFGRGVRVCCSLHDRRVRLSGVVPLLVGGSMVAASGEAWGYLAGLGRRTLRRRAHYELNRVRYVRASEMILFEE